VHDLIESARFLHALKLDDIPEPVIARATLTLLDSFGVMVSGSVEPRVQRMGAGLRRRGGSGRSTFVTDGLPGSAQDGALVNATSMCLHVEDEGHRLAFGHVATYVLPALLAVAQERGASGRELLTAFVAGYELTARLGMAFKVKDNVHPSGTIGGAAGVARLMGFDPQAIVAAMDVAAPLTFANLWRASSEGATVCDLYSGWGSTLSVMAPAWVDAGFTGCAGSVAEVLSNHTGTSFDSKIAVSELGTHWELQRNYFKLHACCGIFIACIEEAMAMQARHGFSAEDIGSVSVKTFETAAVRSAHREPDNAAPH